MTRLVEVIAKGDGPDYKEAKRSPFSSPPSQFSHLGSMVFNTPRVSSNSFYSYSKNINIAKMQLIIGLLTTFITFSACSNALAHPQSPFSTK